MNVKNDIYHLEFSESQKQFHFSEEDEIKNGWQRLVTMPLADCVSFVDSIEKFDNPDLHLILFELNHFLERRNYKKRLAKLN